MKRARAADHSSAVSLFPFLAVLVCTMGALIVLLVVMAREARIRAAQTVETPAPTKTGPGADAASIDGRMKRLAQTRAILASQLAEKRLVLSHLEDHVRRLQNRLRRLQRDARLLANSGESSAAQRRRDKAEIARLQRLITDARQQLDRARREAQRRRHSYSIVPYQGRHGTTRRPIYIECRSDTVIVQPEGVVLQPGDFDEPLGPGNPLAAALRAAREYFADRREAAIAGDRGPAKPADPYPLLLVRPDGVPAYYKVRQALASWDAEFGYELIDADWSLDFAPPDPSLADRESRAVEAARRRRARLARAAPSRYGRGRTWRIRAKPGHGGFERFVEDPTGTVSGGTRHGSSAGGRIGGGRPGSTANGGLVGTAAAAPSGPVPPPGRAGRAVPGRSGGGASDRVAAGTGPSYDGGPADAAGGSLRGHTRGGSVANERGAGGVSGGRTAGDTRSNGQTGSGVPAGNRAGKTAPASATFARRPTAGEAAKRDALAGPAREAAGRGAPGRGAAGGGQTGGTAGGGATVGGTFGGGLAGQRGENWALPTKGRRAIPVSRPVRVVVRPDRLAIMPDRDARAADGQRVQVVPLAARTVEAIDPFVSTLWDHIGTWGIAGQGMYWRPVLHLYVAPGAEQRAAQFTELLKGSGLEIVRKGVTRR